MFYQRNRLNNVIFPLSSLLLGFPPFVFAFIFGNLIIDSIVIIISLILLKYDFKIKNIIITIFSIWIIGYICDFIGFLIIKYCDNLLGNNFNMYDAFENTSTLIISILIILFVGFLITIIDYFIIYFIIYRKKDKKKSIIISIALGIITAPWIFLIPTGFIDTDKIYNIYLKMIT